MNTLTRFTPHMLGAGLMLGAIGCADSGASEAPDLRGRVGAGLQAARNCDDLLTRIQNDAIAKLDLVIDNYGDSTRTGVDVVNGGGPTRGGDFGQDDGLADPVPAAPPTAEPEAPTDSGGEGGSGGDGDVGGDPGDGPTGYSDTNTQVAGVDEADIVKISHDGNRIYLLHGSDLYGLKAWPAQDLSQFGQPLAIEGQPSEMFVHDGKAVVFSSFQGGALLPEEDDPQGDYGYDRSYHSYTKVTVADLAGETPQVLRELYYEGNYTSSRRHADIVRLVMQANRENYGLFYPDIELQDAWGRTYEEEVIDAQLQAWRERTVAAIRNTDLSDWLPDTYERQGENVARLEPVCDSYYVPTAGVTDYGLTRVVALDMAAPERNLDGTTIMGASSVVYANQGSMVLAQPDYRWNDSADFGFVDGQQTALHLFAIEGARTDYQASGWAPGHVLNQFSLDEQDGTVRLSTSGWVRSNPDASRDDSAFWERTTRNQVLAMRADGGELQVVGDTGPIGKPDETIQSTRFLGERAYVVTFRQIDPLIVVDLSDPADLQVLGELEIPGFSEYMHPLGEDHLLTIGRGGTDDGFVQGVQLQVFDVSDDMNPQLVHKHLFEGNSSSEAGRNHKAFTFYAEHDLLAFPLVRYENGFSSTLQVFRVTAEDGFAPLGAVDHSSLFEDCYYTEPGFEDRGWYECGYSPEVRRGLFIDGTDDTFVYSFSYGGAMVHDLDDLTTAVGSVGLPQPRWDHGGDYGKPVPPSSGGGVDVAEPAPAPEPAPVDEEPEPVDAGVGTADGGSAEPAP